MVSGINGLVTGGEYNLILINCRQSWLDGRSIIV
jgi:hypothetical protein